MQDARDAIAEILGPRQEAAKIETDTRLADLGLDSLDAAELFLLLEEKAGHSLDPGSAGELTDVGDLTKLRLLPD